MNLTEKYTTFSKRSYMRAALCVKNSTKLANSVDSRYTAIPHHCPDKTITTCIQEKTAFLLVCHLAL